MRAKGWDTFLLSLLRVIAGVLFSCHGWQKLFGFAGGMGGHGAAHFGAEMWFVGLLESIGGLLIVLGLFTRPVAFILCGEMAFAFFTVHYHRGFWPILNGGEPAVLYCFLYLYLFAAGGGALSLDRAIGRK